MLRISRLFLNGTLRMRRSSSLAKHHKEFIIGIDGYKSLSFCKQKKHRPFSPCCFHCKQGERNIEEILVLFRKHGSLLTKKKIPMLPKIWIKSLLDSFWKQKQSEIEDRLKANSQNLTISQKQEQPRLMREGVRLSNLNALIDHNDIEEMPLEPK